MMFYLFMSFKINICQNQHNLLQKYILFAFHILVGWVLSATKHSQLAISK